MYLIIVYLYTVSVFILHTLFSKGEMLEHAASGTPARAKDNTSTQHKHRLITYKHSALFPTAVSISIIVQYCVRYDS